MLCGTPGYTFYGQQPDLSLFRGSRSRAVYDSTGVSPLPSGGIGAFGQTIDFVNGRYYLSSNDGDVIYRCDLNLKNSATVFSLAGSAVAARGLAVHPWDGFIYYQGRLIGGPALSRIRRVALDGTGDTDILVLPSGAAFEADALAVSKSAGYLFYFMDTGVGSPTNRQIRRCNIDGTGDTLLYESTTFTPREISIDNVGQNIFWSDGFTKISKLPFAGGAPTVLVDRAANVPPLPVWDDAPPGDVYAIHNSTYSHKLGRVFFNLFGGQSPHDPTDIGLWSMNPDGSDVKAEIVYPNIIDKVTRLPSQAALITGRMRLGAGFETTGSGTNAS